MKNKLSLIAAIFLLLTGCTEMVTTADYKDNKPTLDLRQYLNGNISAEGVLKDRGGKVTRYFTVKMVGKWNGNEGTLDEDFVFDDGEKQKRVWKVKFIDDNNFTATAGDVVGEAIGTQHGNAVNMKYVLRVPYKGSTIDLNMDDWMYLVDEKTIINTTTMKKFGFEVGELAISFKKK